MNDLYRRIAKIGRLLFFKRHKKTLRKDFFKSLRKVMLVVYGSFKVRCGFLSGK